MLGHLVDIKVQLHDDEPGFRLRSLTAGVCAVAYMRECTCVRAHMRACVSVGVRVSRCMHACMNGWVRSQSPD